MSGYTPETRHVEASYLTSAGHFTHPGSRKEMFDRWLASVKAEARSEFSDELTRMGVHTFNIHDIRQHARKEQS